MTDKFDLDNIKNLINKSDKPSENVSFSIDDILNDFSSDKSMKSEKIVAVEEITVVEEIAGKKNEYVAVEQPLQSTSIDDDIEKPQGYSLTGAFEAIKNDKTALKKQSEEPQSFAQQENEIEPVCDSHGDKEIFATIEHKRYFTTDTFNSIKNKSSSSVKETIASFANGVEEEDDGEEQYIQPIEETEEIDDYNSTEDKDAIISELKKISSVTGFRVVFTFIITLISLLFFATSNKWISLPGIEVGGDFNVFTIISFVLTVLAVIINYNSIINGIKSLFKLKFTAESFLVIIFVLNTVSNCIYLANKAAFKTFVSFDFIFCLFVLVNIFSKKLVIKTVYKNFLISSADGCKNVINMPNNEEAVNDIMFETGCQDDIVYASKTEFVSDFISRSFKDFESKDSKVEMILFCASVVLTVFYYILKKDFACSLIYLIASLCVVCPVLFTYSFAKPIFSNSKKTRKSGGVIVSSEGAEMLKDVQTLIVDDSDIFNATLNGIRLYGDSSIDDAILYLNSLYNKVGGPLHPLFSDMLSEDILSLPRIDDIYYHDSMGYSGLIHSKVFVAGNKKLMDHFGVEVDDSEYEIIYQQKSKHVLFVAYDGKLMGVFLLSYALSHGVKNAFDICEKNQISVCISERDPNINSKTLFDLYSPKEKVLFNIISFRTARKCFDKFELKYKTPSYIISRTGVKGLAVALNCCKTMMFALKTNKIIRTLASVIALPLITFLLFFSDVSTNLSVQILIYQLLWSLPILFVSFFSK